MEMNKEEMIEKCGEKFYNDFMNARREAMKIYSERKEEFCKRNEERKRKNMENVANIHKKVFGEEKEINTNIINTNIREYKIQDGIFVDICVTFIDNGNVFKKNKTIRHYPYLYEGNRYEKIMEKMYKEVYEYLS